MARKRVLAGQHGVSSAPPDPDWRVRGVRAEIVAMRDGKIARTKMAFERVAAQSSQCDREELIERLKGVRDSYKGACIVRPSARVVGAQKANDEWSRKQTTAKNAVDGFTGRVASREVLLRKREAVRDEMCGATARDRRRLARVEHALSMQLAEMG